MSMNIDEPGPDEKDLSIDRFDQSADSLETPNPEWSLETAWIESAEQRGVGESLETALETRSNNIATVNSLIELAARHGKSGESKNISGRVGPLMFEQDAELIDQLPYPTESYRGEERPRKSEDIELRKRMVETERLASEYARAIAEAMRAVRGGQPEQKVWSLDNAADSHEQYSREINAVLQGARIVQAINGVEKINWREAHDSRVGDYPRPPRVWDESKETVTDLGLGCALVICLTESDERNGRNRFSARVKTI